MNTSAIYQALANIQDAAGCPWQQAVGDQQGIAQESAQDDLSKGGKTNDSDAYSKMQNS